MERKFSKTKALACFPPKPPRLLLPPPRSRIRDVTREHLGEVIVLVLEKPLPKRQPN